MATKAPTGKSTAKNLPMKVADDVASTMAMHTSQLHRTPRQKTTPNGCETLTWATAMAPGLWSCVRAA